MSLYEGLLEAAYALEKQAAGRVPVRERLLAGARAQYAHHTVVRYDWHVRTASRWMSALAFAPLAPRGLPLESRLDHARRRPGARAPARCPSHRYRIVGTPRRHCNARARCRALPQSAIPRTTSPLVTHLILNWQNEPRAEMGEPTSALRLRRSLYGNKRQGGG